MSCAARAENFEVFVMRINAAASSEYDPISDPSLLQSSCSGALLMAHSEMCAQSDFGETQTS